MGDKPRQSDVLPEVLPVTIPVDPLNLDDFPEIEISAATAQRLRTRIEAIKKRIAKAGS